MQSISPVVPGLERFELKIAEDQPEYNTIPALIDADFQKRTNLQPLNFNVMPGVLIHNERAIPVTSRWKLSQEERDLIAAGADLFLTLLTFGHGLQPIMLEVGPDAENRLLQEFEGR